MLKRVSFLCGGCGAYSASTAIYPNPLTAHKLLLKHNLLARARTRKDELSIFVNRANFIRTRADLPRAST